MALSVIPIEGDANVPALCPFGTAFGVLFDDSFEVESMFFAYVFDPKVIDDECKCDGTGFV